MSKAVANDGSPTRDAPRSRCSPARVLVRLLATCVLALCFLALLGQRGWGLSALAIVTLHVQEQHRQRVDLPTSTFLGVEKKTVTKIPKIIHQTWKTADVSTYGLDSGRMWQRVYPDFEYKFWVDSQMLELLDEEPYKEARIMYSVFEGQHPDGHIQQMDLLRYCLIHKYGGIYADMDVEPRQRIPDHVFESKVFIGYWAPKGPVYKVPVLGQAFFAAEAGSPFIMAMLESIYALRYRPPKISPLFSTGPGFFDRVAREFNFMNRSDVVIYGLPEFGNQPDCRKEGKFGACTYGAHLRMHRWGTLFGRIPLIIHQIWNPENHTSNVSNVWQTLYPKMKYMLWKDEDLLKLLDEPPYRKARTMYSILGSRDFADRHIEQWDLLRYCLLHKYGGMYIDLDVQPNKPIPEMFFNNFNFISYWEALPNGTAPMIGQALIAIEERSLFMMALIERIYALRFRPAHAPLPEMFDQVATDMGIITGRRTHIFNRTEFGSSDKCQHGNETTCTYGEI